MNRAIERLFSRIDLDKYIRQEKAAIAASQPGTKVDNPFVSSSRTEIDSLTTALDALQILTSRTHQSMNQNRSFSTSFSLSQICTTSAIVVVVSLV